MKRRAFCLRTVFNMLAPGAEHYVRPSILQHSRMDWQPTECVAHSAHQALSNNTPKRPVPCCVHRRYIDLGLYSNTMLLAYTQLFESFTQPGKAHHTYQRSCSETLAWGPACRLGTLGGSSQQHQSPGDRTVFSKATTSKNRSWSFRYPPQGKHVKERVALPMQSIK